MPRATKDAPVSKGALPDREVLLRFIADHPQKAYKREIAKAFGLKGEARVELKDLLRSLEEDGLVEKKRKSLVRPGALPPVAVLDITTRDADGELIARPAEWLDEDGVAPAVLVRQQSGTSRARGKVSMAGLGDRILAKIFPSGDRAGPAYTARVIKVIDKSHSATMGVFKSTPGGGGRILPIDKRGEEWWSTPITRAKPGMAIWWKSTLRGWAASALPAPRSTR